MTFLLVLALTVAAFVIWRYALVRPPVLAAGRPALDDALAHTPASVIRLDAEGRVVSLHGGWERCTGWSAGETIGKHYLGFIPAEDRARTRALEDRLRDSSLTEISGTVRLTARAGTIVTSEVHLYPQREPTGRVNGAVLIATQASTDHPYGIRLLEGAAAPDAVAAPVLLNGTGRDALGKTLAGLAHELNNPLAVITGFAQILLRSSPTPDDRHAIESILGEARRATSLIRDVITVARGEAHTPAERVDLNALVMSAVAQFRPILESKGITFTASLADAELLVEGVPAQMDRVIHNLIRNAQRHLIQCSAAACRLSVSTSHQNGEVVLEVADSGPTLSAEELERIWDPFAVTGDDADVSGFELAVAHSLVRSQDGSITVSSDPEHGTVFRVKWRAMTDATSPEIAGGTRTAGPLDVLVVEDEVTLRDLLSRYLELRGHAVVLADGGEQALRLAEQNTFDVVVSDVRMPGIGGPELVRRLRQRPSCAHTRFVLSTGDALLDLGDLAREGVTGVQLVHKPYDVSRLASIIESP